MDYIGIDIGSTASKVVVKGDRQMKFVLPTGWNGKEPAQLIREKLKEKGITKEFIYPDPYLIKEVVDKATIESIKRNLEYRDS